MADDQQVTQWSESELADLKDGVESGLSLKEMMDFFMRSADEIENQISMCGFRMMEATA